MLIEVNNKTEQVGHKETQNVQFGDKMSTEA